MKTGSENNYIRDLHTARHQSEKLLSLDVKVGLLAGGVITLSELLNIVAS
jgi:hypothetical protein